MVPRNFPGARILPINLDSRGADQTLASDAIGLVDQGRWSDFKASG